MTAAHVQRPEVRRTISSAISSAAVRTVAMATSVGTIYQPVAKDPMTNPASRPTAMDSTSVARGTPAIPLLVLCGC